MVMLGPCVRANSEISRCHHLAIYFSSSRNGGIQHGYAPNSDAAHSGSGSRAHVARTGRGTGASRQDLGAAAAAPHLAAYAATITPNAGHKTWAYVANYASGTVTPINTAANKASSPITVGDEPVAIALTPNGKTAKVVNEGSDTVTPIDTATNVAGAAISVGDDPAAIAITPNGKTAYVVNEGSDTVTPIRISDGVTGPPIKVGDSPRLIVIAPNGITAYVTNFDSNTVTPIHLPNDKPMRAIDFSYDVLYAIAVTPDSQTVYVACWGASVIAEIQTSTNTVVSYLDGGLDPVNMAVTPDGSTLYVVNNRWITTENEAGVTPIDVATGRTGNQLYLASNTLGDGIAITPDGKTAYVIDDLGDSVTPITTATNTVGTPISVGENPLALAITSDSLTVYVVNDQSNTVTPVSTATNTAGKAIPVGNYPGAIAIMP
jgi:YVTN family beta-propeller protein